MSPVTRAEFPPPSGVFGDKRKVMPKLKSGDFVRMTWAGGNGPHLYIVEIYEGEAYARIPGNAVRLGCEDPLRFYNSIGSTEDEYTLHSIEVLR